MKLPDAIQQAVQVKIQSELKPLVDTIARLRATLDAYEVIAKLDAERRVSNALLTALGVPEVAADPKMETATAELREAIKHAGELVGLPFVQASEAKVELPTPPEPAPAARPVDPAVAEAVNEVARAEGSTPVLPVFLGTESPRQEPKPEPPPPPPPRPKRVITEADIAAAKRLIAEVEGLRLDISNQHPTRLFPLLQAIIAEIRHLMNKIPEDNHLHERLEYCIPMIGMMKNEGNVPEYIRGLAHHHDGDWERLAYKNRRRVADYDHDTEQPLSTRKGNGSPSKAPKAMEPSPVSNHTWPELPGLHALTKPILLAGGMVVPEKLVSIKERFGLDLEWHEIDHDNPRASQTLVQRIRNGKVGAIILLEGVMRHSTYKPVVELCNLSRIPWAMGDKAGVASIQAAFTELERQITVSV